MYSVKKNNKTRGVFKERAMETKNLSLLFGNEEKCNIRNPQEAKFFKTPYSELDILELQDMFLAEGIHHIKTPSVEKGRELITLFLKSLHCFYNPVCLTKKQFDVVGAVNIFDEFYNKNAEKFFYENPNIDFMWVEISDDSDKERTLKAFTQTCGSLQLEKHMPIVVLHIGDE